MVEATVAVGDDDFDPVVELWVEGRFGGEDAEGVEVHGGGDEGGGTGDGGGALVARLEDGGEGGAAAEAAADEVDEDVGGGEWGGDVVEEGGGGAVGAARAAGDRVGVLGVVGGEGEQEQGEEEQEGAQHRGEDIYYMEIFYWRYIRDRGRMLGDDMTQYCSHVILYSYILIIIQTF